MLAGKQESSLSASSLSDHGLRRQIEITLRDMSTVKRSHGCMVIGQREGTKLCIYSQWCSQQLGAGASLL